MKSWRTILLVWYLYLKKVLGIDEKKEILEQDEKVYTHINLYTKMEFLKFSEKIRTG